MNSRHGKNKNDQAGLRPGTQRQAGSVLCMSTMVPCYFTTLYGCYTHKLCVLAKAHCCGADLDKGIPARVHLHVGNSLSKAAGRERDLRLHRRIRSLPAPPSRRKEGRKSTSWSPSSTAALTRQLAWDCI